MKRLVLALAAIATVAGPLAVATEANAQPRRDRYERNWDRRDYGRRDYGRYNYGYRYAPPPRAYYPPPRPTSSTTTNTSSIDQWPTVSISRYRLARSAWRQRDRRCAVTTSIAIAAILRIGTAMLAMKTISASSHDPPCHSSAMPPTMVWLSRPVTTLAVDMIGRVLAGT